MAVTSWSDSGSTAYVNIGSAKTLTVSDATIPLSSLLPTISLKANSSDAYGKILISADLGYLYVGDRWVDNEFLLGAKTSTRVANNTYATASWVDYSSKTIVNTAGIFTANNSTQKTVSLVLKMSSAHMVVEDSYGLYYIDSSTAKNYGTMATVTLNAPPTFNVSNVSYDKSYVYAGLTTASVSVSSLSAKYGGTISEVKLTIGNQTATRTNNGTLSILLGAEGTFTPTVTVTDSRGQVTTKTLDAITVNGYTAPAVSFNVQRALVNGVPNDEGTYGAISADFTFTDVIANLAQPNVAVDGTTASVTWYASRASDGTMSGTVDWSTLSSPATVYGIVDAPNIQVSYQITVTPNDSISSGTPITQTLASAFYTIDFLAGGHGIAFGQPATEEGFFCNMDAHFKDKANLVRALFDFIHPVGSYYETSDTSFNPNNTWGGTWVLETAGQVHVSAGTGYSVSGALNNRSDGGATTSATGSHTLTASEIPAHTHGSKTLTGTINMRYGAVTGGDSGIIGSTDTTWSGSHAIVSTTTQSNPKYHHVTVTATHEHNSVGGGGGHNHGSVSTMQPYIVVNRWHRTA